MPYCWVRGPFGRLQLVLVIMRIKLFCVCSIVWPSAAFCLCIYEWCSKNKRSLSLFASFLQMLKLCWPALPCKILSMYLDIPLVCQSTFWSSFLLFSWDTHQLLIKRRSKRNSRIVFPSEMILNFGNKIVAQMGDVVGRWPCLTPKSKISVTRCALWADPLSCKSLRCLSFVLGWLIL